MEFLILTYYYKILAILTYLVVYFPYLVQHNMLIHRFHIDFYNIYAEPYYRKIDYHILESNAA